MSMRIMGRAAFLDLRDGSGTIQALLRQKTHGGMIGSHLLYFKFLSEKQVLEALEEQFDLPGVELTGLEVPEEILRKVPVEEGFDDLDALRTAIRDSFEREYAQVSRAKVKRALLDDLAENHPFQVPAGPSKVKVGGSKFVV